MSFLGKSVKDLYDIVQFNYSKRDNIYEPSTNNETFSNSIFFGVLAEDGNTKYKLNWKIIQRILEINEGTNVLEYFQSVLRCISPAINWSAQHIDEVLIKDIEVSMVWTSEPKVWYRCFQLIRTDPLTALLILTSSLERVLSSLVYEEIGFCPIMKELLQKEELVNKIGKCKAELLRLFVGPPTSLNLRNIAWHGFFSADEAPKHYISFLFLVTLDLFPSDLPLNVHLRPWCHFNYEIPIFYSNKFIHENFGVLLISIEQSSFVHESQAAIWKRAFLYFWEGRFLESTYLVIPLIEAGFRKKFVSANNCPHRLETAENSEFFTTFDEMLVRLLPDGSENRMLHLFDLPFMDLAFDLLVYPSGPRIRDRLSHGEFSTEEFCLELCSVVMSFAVCCLAKFLPPANSLFEAFERPYREVMLYESRYHHFGIFKSQMKICLQQLDLNSREFAKHSDASSTSSSLAQVDEFFHSAERQALWALSDDTRFNFRSGVRNFQLLGAKMNRKLDDRRFDSLFFSECKSAACVEALRLCVLNTNLCCDCLVLIASRLTVWKDKFITKSLRSRQRLTYQRLLSSLPCLDITLKYCCLLLIQNFLLLQDGSHLSIRKFKAIRKLLENIKVLTSHEKNKWGECTDICMLTLQALL